jgi:hypothetical protein
LFSKRISIFTGHFGSGKTEIAVNYALQLSKKGDKTAIVDFDIVNPYFRTADVKDRLSEKGIRVITPVYANTNTDVPALPSEINTLFENRDYRVVFDVGGDDLGARVLSRYRDEILKDDYEIFLVVNTRRPMTDTEDKILEMINSIEASSRLTVGSLVNNTNMLEYTSCDDVLEGQRMLERVSLETNKPISFISVFNGIKDELEGKVNTKVLYMQKKIRLPWQRL